MSPRPSRTLPDARRPAALLLLAALLASAVYATQQHLDALRAQRSAADLFRYLPRGDDLKVAVLGYDQLAADLLWLKIIQVMGEKGHEQRDAEWVAQALDVMTTLDPKFDYAYQLGGVFLGVMAGRADLAVPLLEKGVANNPTVWRLYFFLGFNQFYYLGQYKAAADAMSKAAALPGRPDYVPLLASRLYAEAREPETALEFLGRMYKMNKNTAVQAQLAERIKEMTAERDLQRLALAVDLYRQRFGAEPTALQELVGARILRALPPEPFGGRYYRDESDHRVKSTAYKERIRVQLPEQRLSGPEQQP